MAGHAILTATISSGAVAALSTIVLAAVGVLTYFANRRLYQETTGQNTATLRIAVEQMETAKLQMTAANEQAEIARRALQLQITPHLIPGGSERCQVGPAEQINPEPQPLSITPVFLEIANAGNGVAVLETDRATARSVRHGASSEMTIILAPALAPGAQAMVKLIRRAPEDQDVAAGDCFEVVIPYGGDDLAGQPQELRFSARYFHESHWQLKVHPKPLRA